MMRAFDLIALCLIGLSSLAQTSSAIHTAEEDLGGTWTKSSYGNGWNWYDITLSSTGKNQTAVATVGTVNSLYTSTDYGVTWAPSAAPAFDSKTTPGVEYWAVASSGDGQYIASVAYVGAIYLSSDYGATWSNPTGPPNDVKWVGITMTPDGKFMGAVIDGGIVWFSADYGVTWKTALFLDNGNYDATVGNYAKIDVSDSGKYWMVASGTGTDTTGNVYFGEYEKNGQVGALLFDPATINGLPAGSSQQWVGVAMSADGGTVTATNSEVPGGVFVSSDRGVTFSLSPGAPQITGYHSVAMSADGLTQIVSATSNNGGYIYLSKDAGQSWAVSSPEGDWDGIAVDDTASLMAAVSIGVGVYSYLPNCPYGEVHTGFGADGVNGCVPCGAGSYEEYFGAATCTDCAEGSYSTTDANYLESTCKDCTYPWTTLDTGSTSCETFHLKIDIMFYAPICGSLLIVLFAMFAFGSDNQTVALLIMGFPALSVITDLTYLLISPFYRAWIFLVCGILLMHPAPMFVHKLYKYRAWPYSIRFAWWLGASSPYSESLKVHGLNTPAHIANNADHLPFPTVLGRRITLLYSFDKHDNLYVIVLEIINWALAIALQGLTLVLLPAFLLFWLCAGVFLQMTKTIAMGSVWNFWFHVWTGYTHWSDVPGSIDTEDLNYGLLAQLCLQTVPLIALQALNNTLLETWFREPIAIFALVVSLLTVVTILCRYTVLKAALPPHTRNIMVLTAEQREYQDRKYTLVTPNHDERDVYSPLCPSPRPSPRPSLLVPPTVGGSNSVLESRLSLNSSFTDPASAGDEEQPGTPQSAYTEPVFMPVPVLFSSHSASAHSSGKFPSSVAAGMPPLHSSAFRPQTSAFNVPPSPSRLTVNTNTSSSGGLSHMSLALPSPSTRSRAPSATTTPVTLAPSPVHCDYPPELICPLTRHVMTDPVICADGCTYERSAIEQHIRSQKELQAQMGNAGLATSPMTKEPLDSEQLFPNRALAALLVQHQGV